MEIVHHDEEKIPVHEKEDAVGRTRSTRELYTSYSFKITVIFRWVGYEQNDMKFVYLIT